MMVSCSGCVGYEHEAIERQTLQRSGGVVGAAGTLHPVHPRNTAFVNRCMQLFAGLHQMAESYFPSFLVVITQISHTVPICPRQALTDVEGMLYLNNLCCGTYIKARILHAVVLSTMHSFVHRK